MQDQGIKLKGLIESSERILIISHISPDPDAVCSLILAGTTLLKNYPEKQVAMTSEELTDEMNFLPGHSLIEVQPLATAISKHRPDLIMMVDAMNMARCTREPQAVKAEVESLPVKLLIIDHHENEGVEPNDLYINNGSPAATQDVYSLLIKQMGLNPPEGYANTTMAGIYSDTGGFIYENSRHRETFEIVNELIDAGVNIEKIKSLAERFSETSVHILGELAMNLSHEGNCTLSYLSDETAGKAVSDNHIDDVYSATSHFANNFLRSVDGRPWGFVVYKDVKSDGSHYKVSLRALSGSVNVADIAKKLGGGGHIPAAAARFEAANIDEAVQKVKQAIES